ncbi:MAG: hypothetical protein ACPGID_06205 [Rubricella sp.]
MSDLERLILLQDILTGVLVAHVVWALRCVFGGPNVSLAILSCPVVVLAWGAGWSYIPALSATRLAPPPLGQSGVILFSLVGLIGFWLSPHVRRRAARFADVPLLQMAVWRAVFGMSVLAVGVAGGLPPAFFWSVGLGDLAVGLIGCALLLGEQPVNARAFLAWNLLGLADLCHVLVLGAVKLVPFFVANPELPFVNLLPLVGVPLLFSLHILSLGYPRNRIGIL